LGAVTLTPEAAIELAMEGTCSPMLRLVLLIAERADTSGAARFEQGELSELLNEGRDKPLNRRAIAPTLDRAEAEGYLLPRGRDRTLRVNTESLRPLGFGVRVVRALDSSKALVDCADCGHRFTALRARADDDTVMCPRCQAKRREMEAR